jgi:anti-anti-sigma factor
MAFQVERRPYFLQVAIKGEASFDQADVIAAALVRIPLDTYPLVVLNLAEMTFISSLVMGVLVQHCRGLWRRGIEVRLANVQPQVRMTLELAGLWKLFQPINSDELTKTAASAGA